MRSKTNGETCDIFKGGKEGKKEAEGGGRLSLFRESHEHRPDNVVGGRLGRLLLEVQVQQLTDTAHCQVVVVVVERRKGIFQNIAGMCEEHKRQHPLVNSLWIVDPFSENGVLNLRKTF